MNIQSQSSLAEKYANSVALIYTLINVTTVLVQHHSEPESQMVNDNTLVAILTTTDSDACVRAYQSVGDYHKVIVVNTPDPDYVTELQNLLPDANIIETPCTGTPGQGKQSVWEYFLTTDHEYLIPMEGDDMFYPGGVDKIVSWQSDSDSDVWWVVGEDILYGHRYMSNWRQLDLTTILTDTGVPDSDLMAMIKYMTDIFKLITQRGYSHHRIIQINRHIAQTFSYNTKIQGSEDVIMNAKLKLSHLHSEIRLTVMHSQEICVYLKHIDTGAGRQFMLSDAHNLRKQFYSEFSESECDFLTHTELPQTVMPDSHSEFQRFRTYQRMLRS
jgi:hypothetical protein